jgi:Zn-finger nucleic acid-binding protein
MRDPIDDYTGTLGLLTGSAFADKPPVTKCENCGAPLRVDQGRFVCDHCGSQQELPEGVPALECLELLSKTSTACPLCSTPLSNGRIDAEPVLCCPQCFGMLIDMSRFLAIIETVRLHEARSLQTALPRLRNPGDRILACPTCGAPMIDHAYDGPGNVVIDSCERCQANWLDPGVLRRIAMAPAGR